MERRFNFEVGNYYHVFNRGVEKQKIFHDEKDWLRFHQLLYTSNTPEAVNSRSNRHGPFELERPSTLTDIIAYALMPNHFHLFVHEKIPGGISKFLAKATTAYSMYFNIKYERSGPVFCRPFRARHVDDDNYFRWLFSYINLNPLSLLESKSDKNREVGDGERLFMDTYRYCSYVDYFGRDRLESKILSKESLLLDVKDLPAMDEMFALLMDESRVPRTPLGTLPARV